MAQFPSALLAACLLVMGAAAALEPLPLLDSRNLPHPPIAINSDADFRKPLSGVRHGSGTLSDPYIISGWLLTPAFPPGIVKQAVRIANASAHVILESLEILGKDAGAGIFVRNATNVTIRSSTFSGLGVGVAIREAKDVLVEGNRFSSVQLALAASDSSSIMLRANDIECPARSLGATVSLSVVRGATVSDNSIRCPDGPGMRIGRSSELSVERNRVEASGRGIIIEESSGLRVADNVLQGNMGESLYLWYVDDFVVEGNRIVDPIGSGLGLIIRQDSHAENIVRANILDGEHNAFWTSGYPEPYTTRFESNLVNGRPIVALVGLRNVTVHGAGQDPAYLLVADCVGVTLTGWHMQSRTVTPVQIINGRGVELSASTVRDGGGVRVAYGAGNRIAGNVLTGITGAAVTVNSPGTVVESNLIDSANNGIAMGSFDAPGREGATAVGSLALGNTVHAGGRPVWLRNANDILVEGNILNGGVVGVLGSPGVVLRNNSLGAGHLYAAHDGWPPVDLGPIDARWNWWGSPDGPQPHDVPEGQSVTVLDDPWLLGWSPP